MERKAEDLVKDRINEILDRLPLEEQYRVLGYLEALFS